MSGAHEEENDVNAWLRDAARGDEAAVASIIDWIQPQLNVWIRKYRSEAVRDLLSTMDVSQPVLTNLFRSLPTLQAADFNFESFRKLLCKIVKNHLISEHRHLTAGSRGYAKLNRFTDTVLEIGIVDGSQGTPSQEYGEKRERAIARVAESLLSPRNQELVLRRVRLRQSWLEIASEMGLDPDAARIAGDRAVAKMATLISQLERGAHAELCLDAESEDERSDAALEMYRSSYEKRRDECGELDPETLACRHNLAVFLREEGLLLEAIRHFKAVLTARRSVLGNSHSDTLATLNNVATFLNSLGNRVEAEPLYREALAGYRTDWKLDDMATLLAIRNLAANLHGQTKQGALGNDANRSKLDEAEALFREALDRCEARFGRQHTNTKSFMTDLMRFLEDRHSADPRAGFDLRARALRSAFE